MLLFPNAKINIGLNITERRPDGYHNLETIFYPIPLCDALEVVPRGDGAVPADGFSKCRLHLSGHEVAGDAGDNLVCRAYRLLDAEFNLPPVDAYLLKQIPLGAGLGGGSADATFMLKLLNQLFMLGLNEEALEERAARLGADCPFFVQNRPTYAEGTGNLFTPLPLSLSGYRLLLAKPSVFVSTRDAFALVRPRHPQLSPRDAALRPLEEWRHCLLNDFEESVFPQYPAIRSLKEELYRRGAIYASMSGSGSSVYGIFAPGSQPSTEQLGDGTFARLLTLA